MDDVRVPPAAVEHVLGRMRKNPENISVAGALPQHAVHQTTTRTTRSIWQGRWSSNPQGLLGLWFINLVVGPSRCASKSPYAMREGTGEPPGYKKGGR